MEWYKVKVTFDENHVIYDEIKGTSEADAKINAEWNWENANIQVISKESTS